MSSPVASPPAAISGSGVSCSDRSEQFDERLRLVVMVFERALVSAGLRSLDDERIDSL